MKRWRVIMGQPWEDRLLQVDMRRVDYPSALWSPAANFRIPPGRRNIRYVIIHITGGPALTERNALNTFRAGPASAHYVVNREGRVVQTVREAHIANHVDNIHSQTNRESIGIEHVNPWDPNPRTYPTDAQYMASARLVAWLCHRYGIPVRHETAPHTAGIRGHIEEAPHSGHRTCPNPAWNWDLYIDLVRSIRVETFDEMIGALAR
ncbi:N-acetylmuramoyl-L-alanine amidase [Hahella sp. HN01]|uniref:N-acetylmuramoyl-L-alanine amidase n=1 Tax=Hahella sp. HN01 TaxID=2847262 RepID=UPI001C1F1152|nr:peptidoglycan recognition family protein [Hahella sp. HN01]MBU6955804.1 N-acetylmuramoyl-L-alanine amidase [Hahella sp. HN01]